MNRLALIALWPLVWLALGFSALRYVLAIVTAPDKAAEIAFMADETANMAINGRVNETVSDRAAHAQRRGKAWGCILCRLLDAIDPRHCERQP